MSQLERKQRALLAGTDSATLRALGVRGDRKPPMKAAPAAPAKRSDADDAPAGITWLIQIGDGPILVVAS